MAFDTWTPPREPHIGSGLSLDQAVLEAKFGDGYVQVMPDGINADFDQVTLMWAGLDAADVDAIKAQYRAKGRATPFYYTMPWDASPKLWRFSGPLTIDTPVQSRFSVSVQLRQAFDLA